MRGPDRRLSGIFQGKGRKPAVLDPKKKAEQDADRIKHGRRTGLPRLIHAAHTTLKDVFRKKETPAWEQQKQARERAAARERTLQNIKRGAWYAFLSAVVAVPVGSVATMDYVQKKRTQEAEVQAVQQEQAGVMREVLAHFKDNTWLDGQDETYIEVWPDLDSQKVVIAFTETDKPFSTLHAYLTDQKMELKRVLDTNLEGWDERSDEGVLFESLACAEQRLKHDEGTEFPLNVDMDTRIRNVIDSYHSIETDNPRYDENVAVVRMPTPTYTAPGFENKPGRLEKLWRDRYGIVQMRCQSHPLPSLAEQATASLSNVVKVDK